MAGADPLHRMRSRTQSESKTRGPMLSRGFSLLYPAALGTIGLLFLFAAARQPVGAQSRTAGEYEVKAAFLYNFAKFIDWPDGSFAGSRAPFSICVLGADPFGSTLDSALREKTIGSHPVTLARLRDAAQARRCQMVFVSSSESRRLSEIEDRLRGASVLLVGDFPGFASAGGALQFIIEDNRVRFLINTDAAQRAGLRLSSKLLSVARVVHDSAGNGKS
jgi:YfiR/HmsC-like